MGIRVYAIALFDSARAAGQLTDVAADMEALAAVLSAAPRLIVFLRAATISTGDKLATVEKVFAAGLHALTRGAIRAMARRDRLEFLPDFVALFQALEKERSNCVAVEAIAATPLEESRRNFIAARVAGALGRRVDLTLAVDPRLIAGVQLRIGDRLIDGTARRKLAALRTQLRRSVRISLREKEAGRPPAPAEENNKI